MRKRLVIVQIVCMCLCVPFSVSAEDALRDGFLDPPASAKARTWWHWVDGNVTAKGITADLEAMQRMGIQEAFLFNVGMGYPEGGATFLSPEWLELFRFAASEAERLGLQLGFHNGAGWSSSGGPWITPEYAMQTVVYSEREVSGGKGETQTFQLPQPPVRLDCYRDIAVFAFPKPSSDERIHDLDFKTLSGKLRNHLEPDVRLIPESAVVRKADLIDLTAQLSADGTLRWKAPAGDWVILRIGYTPTGAENHPAGLGGRGLECDKMSKKAVDRHWDGAIRPIVEKLGELLGSSVTSCLIDSYEVGCTNWTAGFEQAFERLRGYSCMPFLPALAGYYVESGEVTERFLWDFRRTVGDLIAENYYAHFRDLCHQHRLTFVMEPYWGPFNNMQIGETGDLVMCEFWSGDHAFFDSPKMVASIAHLSENPIVGAEAFTCVGGWQGHPATIKGIGDRAWAEGVNRFIYHTYAHQPWDTGPGVTMGSNGFDFNRLNTWWEPGRAYMEYVARAQFMLQQGRSVTDMLVFTGESSPNDAFLMPEIKALGYDYDLIGVHKMASLTVADGLICTPVGGRYRILVLPETTWMTPGLLAKIEELATAGARIIGPKPLKSPSLQSCPSCDATVAQIAGRLWDKGLIREVSIAEVLSGGDFTPDFYVENGLPDDLSFLHRTTDEADIYFVANGQAESRQENCRFRVAGKRPEYWNPETGEIRDVAVWQAHDDGTVHIPIRFDPEEAVFVVFRKPASATGHLVKTTVDRLERTIKPLPGLQIIQAGYGAFLPEGLVDVTEVIARSVQGSKLSVRSGNHLRHLDPAQGSIKELRIEYEANGRPGEASAPEGELLQIDAGDGGDLKIRKAVYGKIDKGVRGVPTSSPIADVTAQIASEVSAGVLIIPVNDQLTNGLSLPESGQHLPDPSPEGRISPEQRVRGLKKELHIRYSSEGEIYQKTVPEGYRLNLAQPVAEPEVIAEGDQAIWKTPYAGALTYVTSSGRTNTVRVESVPAPLELSGSWDVRFPPGLGAPAEVSFDKLISWSASPDEGIRYFSGSATYKKQFELPADLFASGNSLTLDLGRVQVMSEVIVNGKNLGIGWKPPFEVSLDGLVHPGVNELEVRVTNLWPNRLIGDEQLADDSGQSGAAREKWPEWIVHGTERPSERVTFTTWKHWHKDSPLLPSGLLGPVQIRSYRCVKLDPVE
jgi:hypothetical protein